MNGLRVRGSTTTVPPHGEGPASTPAPGIQGERRSAGRSTSTRRSRSAWDRRSRSGPPGHRICRSLRLPHRPRSSSRRLLACTGPTGVLVSLAVSRVALASAPGAARPLDRRSCVSVRLPDLAPRYPPRRCLSLLRSALGLPHCPLMLLQGGLPTRPRRTRSRGPRRGRYRPALNFLARASVRSDSGHIERPTPAVWRRWHGHAWIAARGVGERACFQTGA